MADAWVCPECGKEVLPETTGFTGLVELIEGAAQKDEGWQSVVAGEVEITLSCQCPGSSATVEFGPGKVSAWDVPEQWTEPVVLDGGEAGD